MARPGQFPELRSISQANLGLIEEGERLLRASEEVKDPEARKHMVAAAKRLLEIAGQITTSMTGSTR